MLGREPFFRLEAWTSFAVGDAILGIHAADQAPERSRAEISLIVTEPLERVGERLTAAGTIPMSGIRGRPFGRSIRLRDPDGSPIQANEHAG